MSQTSEGVAVNPTSFADKVADAQELVIRQLSDKSVEACVTSSFQAEDVVVLHLVTRIAPDIPVLFLDTGYHFAETYEYRDRITALWKLKLDNLLPRLTVQEQEKQFGILNQTAPDKCCAMRKVEPLFAGLERFGAWFTGLRREQSKTRADLKTVDSFVLPNGKSLRKISPLAGWLTRDVWQYAAQHEIPLLPLYDKGYSSIGCEPCTSLPLDPNDPRSGRWSGRKVECGIHVQAE
jgi:phosphoadenosine phosphosulfate reductase